MAGDRYVDMGGDVAQLWLRYVDMAGDRYVCRYGGR